MLNLIDVKRYIKMTLKQTFTYRKKNEIFINNYFILMIINKLENINNKIKDNEVFYNLHLLCLELEMRLIEYCTLKVLSTDGIFEIDILINEELRKYPDLINPF
jgi:hypothetical protein